MYWPLCSLTSTLMINRWAQTQPSFCTQTSCQATHFEEIENNLSTALSATPWNLKPNPSKTQSCAFHVRNRKAGRTLNISWQGVPITYIGYSTHPKYLGITLDRSLPEKLRKCQTESASQKSLTLSPNIHQMGGICSSRANNWNGALFFRRPVQYGADQPTLS